MPMAVSPCHGAPLEKANMPPTRMMRGHHLPMESSIPVTTGSKKRTPSAIRATPTSLL